jgi:glyoxylase I family protein
MSEKKSGLPGLRSLDHFGFTVPDLEQAKQFLVEVMGCEYMYSLGPFKHDDNWMQERLNVHPRAVMEKLHFFKVGRTAILEVFQYSAPDQREVQPRNSDIGGNHIAFYVEDIDVAVQYLRESNIQVLGEISASKNASEGQRWVYFLSPWGMQFELVSYPNGKAWDKW